MSEENFIPDGPKDKYILNFMGWGVYQTEDGYCGNCGVIKVWHKNKWVNTTGDHKTIDACCREISQIEMGIE